jgi:predicted enzyme related to lactoylglutathione lyase
MFGWTSFEENGYYQLSKDDKLVAGLLNRDDSNAEHFSTNTTVFFTVNSADEFNEKIKQNGGTVVKDPHDVLDKGRMGIYKDPQGAFFGTWEAKSHKGMPVFENDKQHGLPCWFEINTKDLESTRNFYCNVFGFDSCSKNMHGTEYSYFFKGDELVGGCLLMTEGYGDLPSYWLVYIYSDDVDTSADKVKELGGNVNITPSDVERLYRYSMVNDPSKISFSILSRVKKDMPELIEENERLMKEHLYLTMRQDKMNHGNDMGDRDGEVGDMNITNEEIKDVEMKDQEDLSKKRKREEEEPVETKKRKMS